MKRGQSGRIRIIIPIILIALIGGGIWAWLHFFSGAESTDDAQVDSHVYPVNARVGGTIAEVNVAENQIVEAGAVLIRIDDRDYRNALNRAQADLHVAQAGFEEAKTGVPLTTAETGGRLAKTEASLQSAKSGVETAQKDYEVAQSRLSVSTSRAAEVQTTLSKATKDLDRMKTLIAKDEVSQQQYDAAAAAYDAAKTAVDSAKANIVEAQSAVVSAQARVAQARSAVNVAQSDVEAAQTGPQEVAQTQARVSTAQARIGQAHAAIDQAKTNIDYTVVRAPVAGMVTRKNAEVGQVVQSGQPLLAIVPLREVWVTANFKETQLKEIRVGQAAEVQVDAYGGPAFKGHVDSISAATGARFSLLPAENASGNYVKVVQRIPVKVVLDAAADADRVLRPGMSVVVKVITKAKS